MVLKIWDFGGEHTATTSAQLESVLTARYGNEINGFWLAHGDERNPTLALLVNGNLSTVTYFPTQSHPGFVPSQGMDGLDKDGTSTFSIDRIENKSEVLNAQVIPFARALAVAQEFLLSNELPRCLDWTEL